MDFDVKDLEYFVSAAEHPSFRRAAANVGVRQSVLSRRIRALEDQLGVSLFERDQSGVRLTVTGRRLLPRARSSLSDLRALAEIASQAGRGAVGHLRIGTMQSLGPGFFRDLVSRYAQDHPDVDIDYLEGGRREQLALLRGRQLDVGLLTGARSNGLEATPLWRERVMAALPEDHPLADRGDLGWGDLGDQRFLVPMNESGQEIQDFIIRKLSDRGFRPSITGHQVSRELLMHLVGLGLGVALTSEAAAGVHYAGVVFRPLSGPDDLLQFSAVWSRDNDNPALRRFISLARSMAKRAAQPAN
ncbi:transcriptional regulator, LysR family [Tistlia consotensis]|uniref:Transcriptional regulator, LysR family n=1 Tax=Tistlia consotensis USBA 355 TaxID=560819 RepID=A0A1Y6CXJ5_9PROT|nr:LysR family transcriptional regulator [Tistlia consotensis]SMF84130.1 transcriptional regulator, LysR family [Tistlia consotensis USBA 355]SNS35899.1 transcriptional regulator, LysR family [Tistlia consotensis]